MTSREESMIERLRKPVFVHTSPAQTNCERREAADLIERLMGRVAAATRSSPETVEVIRKAINKGFSDYGLTIDWRLRDFVAETIAAALTHPAQVARWPIIAAPRDGTWLLLYSEGINTKYSHWTVGQWRTVGRTSERGPGWYDDQISPIHNVAGFALLPPETAPTDAADVPQTPRERLNEMTKTALINNCDHDCDPEHDPRAPWGFEAWRCKKCGTKFHIPKGEAV